ncbi:unnamed protein product [Phaedon cochleariae]|uniref:DUF4806 domain-containing protein n=1 Tax=Phaedon cochleariae TaxID=80249 RepID=A0A9N9S9D6_PHACE|nr:unnamed protein product [Phaedon cochleariae]
MYHSPEHDLNNIKAIRHKKALSTDEETESSGNELTVSSKKNGTRKKYPRPPRTSSDVSSASKDSNTNDHAVSNITTPMNLQTVDEIIKSIHKQQILTRNISSQVLEELQQLKEIECVATEKDNENISIFSIFHFSLMDNDGQLNDVEEYLKDEKNFTSAINVLSKLGGSNVYEVKRCLNSSFSNTYAAEYSWLGMKKKKSSANSK